MRNFGYYFAAGVILAIGLGLFASGVGLAIAGPDLEHPYRRPIGLAFCAVGAAGVAVGWRMTLRPFRSPHPEILAIRVVRLARALGGAVTVPQIVSGLRVPERDARAALQRLMDDDVCVEQTQGAEHCYVFPSLTGDG